jgi:ppGpp synthetase/RelA/SpoT-type nucleotidyltranferase
MKLCPDIDEKDEVPIYLTKCRVKSADSIYLKVKKDNIDNLDNITDFAGFRILCLFEQDIFEIHKFIINKMCTEFILDKFKLFNWGSERYRHVVNSLINIISDKSKDTTIETIGKESGYKSIHYLFKQKIGEHEYYVEVQLRTLLQDVWGELEHSLSYKKGNIHPHIKKSFNLLSMDLEKNDLLMSHLKTISGREKIGHLYSLEEGGPVNVFGYEHEILPDIFDNEPYKSSYNSYIEFLATIDFWQDKAKQIKEAKKCLERLTDNISIPMIESDINIKYFIEMEKAFLYYWEGGRSNFDKALLIYEALEKEFKNHYILYFRMGEIYFIKDEIVKALTLFDLCDRLIQNGCHIEPINLIKAKIKLAYYYWLLGQEYIDYSIAIVNEVETIYDDNPILFSNHNKRKLLNNICSYYLEKYLITKNKYEPIVFDKNKSNDETEEAQNKIDECYKNAKLQLDRLMNDFDEENASANILDTVAWFYYNIYLKEGDRKFLNKAKEYCQLIGRRENYSTFKITSLNIHINHIQEIMGTK